MIIDSLEFEFDNIKFELVFKENIVAVGDSSAVGKSFMCHIINVLQNGIKYKEIFKDVILINWESSKSFRGALLYEHNKMFIVDNADLVITAEIGDLIDNNKNGHQFLVFGRALSEICLTLGGIAELKLVDNKFKLEYPNRGRRVPN